MRAGCPTSTIAAADGTGQYGIAIDADLTDLVLYNGYNEQTGQWNLTTDGITATACGLLMLPSLQVVIPASGLVFDISHEVVHFVLGDGLYRVKLNAAGTSTTTLTGVRAGALDGQLDALVHSPLDAEVVNGPDSPFPLSCPFSVDTTLTTTTSTVVPPGRPPLPVWTLTGAPVSGPIVGATADLVANDFVIPALAVSTECNQGILLDNYLDGSDANGNLYQTIPPTDIPAGASQATATLRITAIDEAALPPGPPATVPGT